MIHEHSQLILRRIKLLIICQQKPGRPRGSKAKPAPPKVEDDDDDYDSEEEEEREMKTKPVDARYIRGPPITKSQKGSSETILYLDS